MDHQTNALLTDRPTDQPTDGHSQLQRCFVALKTYKSKRYQIYFTDKYLHAASYTNSTMKNGLKSFTFPRYQGQYVVSEGKQGSGPEGDEVL